MATEEVYCTLLTNDRYLPGAMVLSHALRDGGMKDGVAVPGTSRKLAVLVAEGRLSEESLEELELRYDYVIPVPIIAGNAPDNLQLLGRLELNETFTKINLWNQTQFKKILYLDADVLPLYPPDELFVVEATFAASPDIGWPDCFNSGVMLLAPSEDTYQALLNLAQTGRSFDGADQGLLNTYFSDWHRLGFTYNCTPSASYQYTPAYRHFGSKVSVVHFIGASKPWDNRGTSQHAGGPFAEHVTTWWNVWDKHYVAQNPDHAPTMIYKFQAPKSKSVGVNSVSGSSVWAPPPKVAGHGHSSASNNETTDHAAKRATREFPPSPKESFRPQVHHVVASPTPTVMEQKLAELTLNQAGGTLEITTGEAIDPPTPEPRGEYAVELAVIDAPEIVTPAEEEHEKTWAANSLHGTPIIPQLSRTTVQNIFNGTPVKHSEAFPVRPHSPIHAAVLPEFEPQYRPHQPKFRVGGTFYVHRSNEEAMPSPADTIIPSSPIAARGYVEPFQAPQFQWDPARSAPPSDARPEASNFPQRVYRNEWDVLIEDLAAKKSRSNSQSHTPQPQLMPEESKRAVFPWETRVVVPTRVFSDDLKYENTQPAGLIDRIASPELISEADDDDTTVSLDEEPESCEGLSDVEFGEDGGDASINQWEASFTRPQQFAQSSFFEDEEQPIRRRNRWVSSQLALKYPSAQGIPAPEQWDPNAKLNDLRKLPESFLARQARRDKAEVSDQQ